MAFFPRWHTQHAFVVVIALGLAGHACGGDSDPADDVSRRSAAGNAAAETAGGAEGEGGNGAGGGSPTIPSEQSVELDRDGGVLEVGYARLIVPAGALDAPTTITLRYVAAETSVLDDVYEMLPSGLAFDEPALFLLDVGPEHADPAGERRVLSYVDGPAPAPLPHHVSIPSEGTYAGTVLHFSHVAASPAGAAMASEHFGGFDFAQPYSVKGACGELESKFAQGLPTSGNNKEGSAAETNVDCSTARVEWQPAPAEKGRVCVTIVIPPSARESSSSVFYPSWDDRPERCDAAWDDFLSRLATHESLHQDIGRNGCDAAIDAATNTTACGRTEAAAHQAARQAFVKTLNSVLTSTQAAQDALDVGPDHGVTMDCECQCEDPCEHFDQATQKCVPIECAGECEKCVEGECQASVCDECVQKSARDCPAGSSWDSAAQTCVVHCASGGTIAGLPCVYIGTSSVALVGTDVVTSAAVTLQAKGFDGCLVVYEPISGTVTASPPSSECFYDPATTSVEQADNTCIFKIMPGADPYLVADCGSMWDSSIHCDDQSAATPISGLWLYTTRGEVAPGGHIAGTYVGNGLSTTFDFSPE
jgi:hypothetical protein